LTLKRGDPGGNPPEHRGVRSPSRWRCTCHALLLDGGTSEPHPHYCVIRSHAERPSCSSCCGSVYRAWQQRCWSCNSATPLCSRSTPHAGISVTPCLSCYSSRR